MLNRLKKLQLVRRVLKRKKQTRSTERQLSIELLETRLPLAIDAQLVKDINPTQDLNTDGPKNLLQVGNTLYFVASTNSAGKELWKSDGSSAGTELVKDIRPGSMGSDPRNLMNVNGTLFFVANDGSNGYELWKSDGTASGTYIVKNISEGEHESFPSLFPDFFAFAEVNGALYFKVSNYSGRSLWKSDGTEDGTVFVRNFQDLDLLTNVNGTLYFNGDDGWRGEELWKSDGTYTGTLQVKDIRPGGYSNPSGLTNISGVLFFRANDGTRGYELWKSDGTSAGTVLIKDIRGGSISSYPSYFTNVNGIAYFIARDFEHGDELWKSDGTSAGTQLVKDIRIGNEDSSPRRLSNINGTLFFQANDGTNGTELWKSDGTFGGTVLVKDIQLGSATSQPTNLTDFNGTLYFSASDGINGSELWRSDGTAAGTVLVKDIRSGSESGYLGILTNTNGTLFFQANDGINGAELWKSDGTGNGTLLLKDIRTGTLSSSLSSLTNANGTLYLTNQTVLWKSDGTENGTASVNFSSGYFSTRFLTNVGGTLYFEAYSLANGRELGKSDGTTSGTILVSDIRPGFLSSYPSNFTDVNGILFFTANDGINGPELWKSDGTSAGTVLVKDIQLGSNGSYPRYLTNSNGTLFFRAGEGRNGYELWKSDGTAAGTVLVKDIKTGVSGSGPILLTNIGGTLYFVANDGSSGYELWKSNGTDEGTVLVKDIWRGVNGFVGPITNVNGTLFFAAGDGVNGSELWKSNGTAAGTVLVKDIRSGSKSSYLRQLTNANGTLFFQANDGTTGSELWKSDGSLDGTTMVRDVCVGECSSILDYSARFTNIDNLLYFGANDGTNGTQLWITDGTTAGTVSLANFVSQSGILEPNNLVSVGKVLFYTSITDDFGDELWKVFDAQNQAPTGILLSANTIAENADSNAELGALFMFNRSVDDIFTYELVAGAGDLDNSDFSVNGFTLRATKTFDFEIKSNYTIRIRSTDQRGLFTEKAFSITVTNVNESPKDISLSPNSISENAGFNASIGTFSTTDPDGRNTFTYTFAAGTGDADNAVFNIVGSTLKTSNNFDFETKSNYTVRLRSTDQQGLWVEKPFAILITDVNDAPSDINLSASSLPENAGVNVDVAILSTTDQDTSDTFTYSLVAGAGDGDNSAFSIAGSILRATNSFDFETKSSYTVRIRTTDQGGLFTEKAFTTSVINVNETPTDINLFSSTIAENSGTNAQIGTLSTIDPDFGNTFSYSLVAGNGDADNTAFNISGSTLRATSDFDFESKSSYTIRIRSTDAIGLFLEKSFAITVTNVNEAPTNIELSSRLIAENAGTNATVCTLSASDLDAGDTFTYTLVSGIGDADNSAFNISGATLRATDSFNFESKSSYTVRIRSTDQGGLFTEKAFTIEVVNVNEVPTNIDLSISSIPENSGADATVGTLSTLDPDFGNTFTYSLIAGTGDTNNSAFSIVGSTLIATNGFDFELKSSYNIRVRSTDQEGLFVDKAFTITVTDVNETPSTIGLTSTTIAENAGPNASVGTLSTIDQDTGNTYNYALASGAGDTDNASFTVSGSTLRTTSSFDFETKSSYAIRLRSTDQGGLFTEKTFVITVTNVNETPSDLDLTPKTIAENSGANATVGTLSSSDPDAVSTFVYTLVAGNGDTDNAAFNISGLALRATQNLDFETKSSYSVRVRSTDQGGLFAEKTFTITVANVNEVPANLDVTQTTIPENSGADASVGIFSTIDPDVGSTFVYTLVSGVGDAGNAAFNISGSTLRATSSFDFETKSSYTVRVRSTDQGGLFTEKAFTISVTNVNETPNDLDISLKSIAENSGSNATVGTLTTIDPDAGNSFIYSLVSGAGDADNATFRVSGSAIITNSSFDFETKSNYSIRIRSTDQGGLFTEKSFTIVVTNVNETPIDLDVSMKTIAENSGANATVGNLTTIDPDIGSAFIYALVAGIGDTDNAAFNVVGSTIRATNSFDFERKSSYSVRMRSTDQGGIFTEKAFVITVVNVNETPTDLDLSPKTIAENGGANSIVGTLRSTDPDSNSTFSYTLVTGAGSTDNESFAIVNDQLKAIPSFDFENKKNYSIRIRTTDEGGLSFEKTIPISILDVNEVPGIQLTNVALSVNESNTTGLVVADFGIVDDALGSNSVSLSGPDASLFEVVGGKLRLKPSQLDFETKPVLRVTVSVDDATLGSTPDQSIDVVLGVVDVNEAPTEVRLNNLVSRLSEEVIFAQPTLLADIAVVDDALGTSQLVLSGPDSSHFEVRDRKLWLKPGTRFDFEIQSTYQARIEAFDPSLINSPNVLRNFVLSVDNVPEVTGVTIVDGTGWQESVKRVQIQWDMAVNLSNSAIRWNKSDVDNASVSFATQTYLINGRTVADMQFNGKYADEVGLLDGDYELMVLGDQVASVTSSLSGLGFVERYQAVRPKNPFEVKIVLASPVGIGSGAIMTAQVVGLNETGNSIRYEVDWNADGVVDRTVLGGSSISIENVSFATGGSRTIHVEAKRAGQSIAKGRSVVDVVPLTTRGSSWFSTLDVDMDSTISPLDVLTIVNRLNETSSTRPYDVRLDVDRDQSISPLDVLAIINRINANAGSGPPTPFVSVAMEDTGASDGLTSTASVTGVVKDAGAKLFVSLDGKPRKEVVGAIRSNGQFDLTDAAMSQLFGSSLEGDHLLTVGTISAGGGWEAMDRRFTRISRLPNAFEILTAVQKDGLRLAWTTAGDGVRYRVVRKVEGQSPIVMAEGLAELATRINLSQGLHDLFVEAYDHLGNTTKTQMLKIQVN